MNEYKITRQAVDTDWTAVAGAPAREMDLYTPAGDDWNLHSFEHGEKLVVAVWVRAKRHGMSDVYSHAEGGQAPVKTIADMPEPK